MSSLADWAIALKWRMTSRRSRIGEAVRRATASDFVL